MVYPPRKQNLNARSRQVEEENKSGVMKNSFKKMHRGKNAVIVRIMLGYLWHVMTHLMMKQGAGNHVPVECMRSALQIMMLLKGANGVLIIRALQKNPLM